MNNRSTKRERGFSLLEMLIAMTVGSVVLGAAVQLYCQGVSATWTVSQTAELQQDFRAASDMMTKDVSLAGAGLNQGAAIVLPSAITPRYACDQGPKCYLGPANLTPGTYPLQGGVTPTLYGLIPGYQQGPTLTSNPNPTDAITVVYTDTSFTLNCYAATVTAAGVVTFGPNTVPDPKTGLLPVFPPPGCLPTGVPTVEAVNDPQVGLTPGDLVYFPSLGGKTVIAEMYGSSTIPTGVNAVGTTYRVQFNAGDPLRMNQLTSTGLNNVPLNSTGLLPCRLLVITYYIDNTVSPPRLMRQISGHTPMPVVDGVVYMQFSYDLFNDATGAPAVNQPNPGFNDAADAASAGLLPNQITKINILHMAMDSAMHGTKGYQGLDLETSVSARNLTFVNNYPN